MQPPVVTSAPYVGTLPMSANLYPQPHIISYPYTVHPHTYAPSPSGFQPTPAIAAGSFSSVFSVTSHAGSAVRTVRKTRTCKNCSRPYPDCRGSQRRKDCEFYEATN